MIPQLSNVVFLLLPPVLMHLFRDYGRFVNPGIHVIWFLMMIVGASSAYFHATLSLIGKQMNYSSRYDSLIILTDSVIDRIILFTMNFS